MHTDISLEQLSRWCRVPAAELSRHPDLKIRVDVLVDPDAVHGAVADSMFDEVQANNLAGLPTRWILPCGPTGQYVRFAQRVNEERLSLENVHVFHMDDFLDWQGRPLPTEHPYSLKGWMLRNFYGAIDPELNVAEQNRHFPDPTRVDEFSATIGETGIDTAYGGVGYRGHIAFNEPPRSPWYSITEDDFRRSKTRVLALNDDTLIAVSQRTAGGCTDVVPPLAITIGMADILSARRIRLLSVTGAWKQTVVRVAAFSPPTVSYPVTLLQGHSDVSLSVDEQTAAPPLEVYGV
jgi:glucosamine-6-phosphate deaminase